MSSLCVPFGKYSGEPITELPSSYLCWLVTLTKTRRDESLLCACVSEIGKRALGGKLICDLMFDDM